MSTANIIGNAIFGLRNKSGGNYIDPAVKESLVGLWKFDQNTNESPTRNIIKNTIKDKGGDLELLNFAYKANSGYNGYPEDFTSWGSYNAEVSKGGNKAKNTKVDFNLLYTYSDIKRDIEPFKVKISNFTKGIIRYGYRQEDGIETILLLEPITVNNSNGLIELPKSYNTVENGTGFRGGFTGNDTNIGVTIEQLPLYEGALVTDGKDDMIVSQKTVQEMLGGSKKITVVSMIHHINNNVYHTNYIRSKTRLLKNYLFENSYGKSFIYGYTATNVGVTGTPSGNLTDVILGDKKDLYSIANNYTGIDSDSRFSIEGYINSNNGVLYELSEVAVYWTFIANKVLTTDEINQIIGYYKLDKYVTPQVIYDVKRQGLTNDTPAADWYLKDFSGNGYDMQLYNYAKSKDSGIGKYAEDFTEKNFIKYNGCVYTKSTIISSSNQQNITAKAYNNVSFPKLIIRVKGLNEGNKLIITYPTRTDNTVPENLTINTDGIYELIDSYNALSDWFSIGALIPQDGISVEQIPNYEGALVSDGIDDYGKVENLPIYKDYTVAIDRAWTNDLVKAQCLTSKLNGDNFGSFSFELIENGFSSYSFGISNKGVITIDSNKKISYQSKYVYNGSPIISGNNVDGKDLFLFRNQDSYPYYAEAAIWSYILFPYTLSEFLLERQLKKYKLGTLYPDMVEVRPIVKSNTDNYTRIEYRNGYGELIQPGSYRPVGSILRISVVLNNTLDEVSSLKVNGVDIPKSNYSGKNFWIYDATVTKSPQKINITIDEYIRFENIVQPYPEIWTITQNGNKVSWGDKLKVGSEFIIQSKTPLLPELYTSTNFYYNGNVVNHSTPYIVEKQMTFACDKTWKLNTTEPHAIYSPQKLNIPNSSYKILRYIPDLTGKGNHGKLNNFAYALNSGANGYTENYSVWRTANTNIVITDSKIKATGKLTSNFIAYTTASINKHKIKITGIPNGDSLRYSYILDGVGKDFYIIEDGVYDIPASDAFSSGSGFLISNLSSYDWSNITIEEIGEHEGSICFDGTDDHITIPTLAYGGKCVMMKVNSFETVNPIYEQRNPNIFFPTFCIFMNSGSIAYVDGNNGKTYIDGVLNSSITGNNLVNILHNITVTNENITTANSVSPKIGVLNTTNTSYADMAMYEFMLFPEIPSEDEIKKLNDVMGIEGGYVESPNYYWDAYGKKNTDTDRNLIADQVSKDVANALEVKNVAYNSESGYTDDNGLLLDGVEDHAVNTAIPAVTDFTVIAKRKFPESALANNQTFLIKGDAINGNNNVNSLLMECYYGAQNYIISFSHQQIVPLEESKFSWITPTSYNGNALTKGSGVDSAGLTIGRYRDLYRKAVFYKLMFYTKTIDQLSINMLKNLFERDELIDVNNPIFKKEELTKIGF